MNRLANLALVAVVAAAAGAIGLAILRPVGNTAGGQASPSPTSSPSPLPQPYITNKFDPLKAGRYALAGFPVHVSFEVPAGWEPCSAGPVEQGVCGPGALASPPGFTFSIIENVVANPCDQAANLLDPPVGPTVDALVAAISSLEGFTATPPVAIVVDGYAGKQFEVAAPTSRLCDLRTWATADRVNGVGSGETNILRVIDVDGARVLIAAAYFPGLSPPDTRSVLEAIAASIQIRP